MSGVEVSEPCCKRERRAGKIPCSQIAERAAATAGRACRCCCCCGAEVHTRLFIRVARQRPKGAVSGLIGAKTRSTFCLAKRLQAFIVQPDKSSGLLLAVR